MNFPGRIAVLGGGSWATALAKLLLNNEERIAWYMRRPDRIEDFCRTGHNPAYLSDVEFPTHRIDFSSDINEVCTKADTLVIALPSPYIKSHLAKIDVDISSKNIVVATKGIVPDEILKRKKFPFQAPGMSAMIKKPAGIDFLDDALIKKYGVFDVNYINELKQIYSQDDFKLMGAYEIDYLLIAMTVTMLCERYGLRMF